MSNDFAHRFEEVFAPRIAVCIAGELGPAVRVEVVPRTGRGHPTRIRISGTPTGPRHAYAHPLDLSLTWDSAEIERLMEPGGEARFEHYLESIARKLHAWESARPVDFGMRTQGDPEILIGGLDFEG